MIVRDRETTPTIFLIPSTRHTFQPTGRPCLALKLSIQHSDPMLHNNGLLSVERCNPALSWQFYWLSYLRGAWEAGNINDIGIYLLILPCYSSNLLKFYQSLLFIAELGQDIDPGSLTACCIDRSNLLTSLLTYYLRVTITTINTQPTESNQYPLL